MAAADLARSRPLKREALTEFYDLAEGADQFMLHWGRDQSIAEFPRVKSEGHRDGFLLWDCQPLFSTTPTLFARAVLRGAPLR